MRQQNILMSSYIESSKAPQMQPLLQHPLNEDLQGINAGTVLTTGNEVTERAGMHIQTEELEQLGTGQRQQTKLEMVNDRVHKVELRQKPPNAHEYQNQDAIIYNDGRIVMDPNDPRVPNYMASTQTHNQMMSTGGVMDLNLAFSSYNQQTQQSLQQKKFHLLSPKMYEKYLQGKISILPLQEFKMPLEASEVSPKLDYHDTRHQRISPRPDTSHQQQSERSPSKQKFSNQQIKKRLQSGSALANEKAKPQLIGGGFNKGRYSGVASQSRIENSLDDDYEDNVNAQGNGSITSTTSAQRKQLRSQGHSMSLPNNNIIHRGKKPSTAKQVRGVQTSGNRKLYDTPHFGNDKDSLEMHTLFHQQRQQHGYDEAVCSPNYEEVQRMSVQSKEVYQQADLTSLITSPPEDQHNQSNLNSTTQEHLNASGNLLQLPQSASKKNVLISKKSFHNPPGTASPDIEEALQQTSIPQVQLVTNSDVNGTQSSVQQNESSPVCEPNQIDLNAQQEALLEHIIEETCESLDSAGGLGGGSHHTMKSNFNNNNNVVESPSKVNQEIDREKVVRKKKRVITRQYKGSITHQPIAQSELQESTLLKYNINNEKYIEELQIEERPLTERRILISNAANQNEMKKDQIQQLDQPYAITNQSVNVRIKKVSSKNSLENANLSARSHSSQNKKQLDKNIIEQDIVKLRDKQIFNQKSPNLTLRAGSELESQDIPAQLLMQNGKDIPQPLSQTEIQAIQKEGIILGLGIGQGRIHGEREQTVTVHTKHTLQVMSSRGDFDAQPRYDSDSQLSQRHKLGKSESQSKELVARVPSQNGFNQVGVKDQLSLVTMQNKRSSISQLSKEKNPVQGKDLAILDPHKQNSSIKTPQASIIQGVTQTQQNFFNSNSQVVVKNNGQTVTQTKWIYQGNEAPFPQGADFLGVRISQKDQGMSTDDRGHQARLGSKRSLQQFTINAVVEFVAEPPKDILSNEAERKENRAMNHQKFIVPSSTFKIDAKKEQMLKRNIHFHRKANQRIREIQSQAVSQRKSCFPNNNQDKSSSQCGARKSSQIQDSYLNQSMGNPSQSVMIDPDYYFQHMNSGDNSNNIQGIEQFCNSWLATPTHPPHFQMAGAQLNNKRTKIPITQKFQIDHQQNVIEGGFGELAKANISTAFNQQHQPSIITAWDTQNQQKQEDNSTIKDESIYYPQSSIHQHLTKPMITGGLIASATSSPQASPKGQKQIVQAKQHPSAIVNIATSNLSTRQPRLPASTVPVNPKIITNNAQEINLKNTDISATAITPDLIAQQNRILSQAYTDTSTPNAIKSNADKRVNQSRMARPFHEVSESQTQNQQAFKKVEVNQFLPLMQSNLNVPIIHQKGQSSNISQDSEQQVSYSSHQLQMQSNHRKLKSSMGITNFYNPLPGNRSIYTAPSSAGFRQRPTQANSSDLRRNSDNHTGKSSSNQEAFLFKSDHQIKPSVAFGSSNHLLINRKSADHSSKGLMPAINQSYKHIMPPMTAGAHNSPRQHFKLQGNHINIQRSRPATTTNALKGIPGYSAFQIDR